MERDEKIDIVKKDLRRMRKVNRSIDVALQVKERQEKRLAYLFGREQNEEIKLEIEKVNKNLSALRIDEWIKDSNTLEAFYMNAINKLEPLDRTIILDGYINGKPYWKVGRDIGFTEVGIKKRVRFIIEKITKIVYGS